MGMTMSPVSFWNADMNVGEVVEASFQAYFEVKSLKQFSKQTYSLYRIDDGTYLVRFDTGDFFRFKP